MRALSIVNHYLLVVHLSLACVCGASQIAPYAHFIDDALANASACCDTSSTLSQVDNEVKCVPRSAREQSFVIVGAARFRSHGTKCVGGDVAPDCVGLQTESDGRLRPVRVDEECELGEVETHYPKCCPPGHDYDARRHRCAEAEAADAEDAHPRVMKIGLACPAATHAIVDYPLGEEDKGVFDKRSKSLRLAGRSFNYGEFCIDRAHDTAGYFLRACLKTADACGDRRCLWKCCPDGQIYVKPNGTKRCVPSADSGIDLYAINATFIKNREDHNFGLISADLKPNHLQYFPRRGQFHVDRNGDVEVMIDHVVRRFRADDMVYCIEKQAIASANGTEQQIYVFNVGYDNSAEIFKSVVFLLSAIFAGLTISCYAVLPEKRNLHGKCVMMECAFLILGSAILFYTKHFPGANSPFCRTLAYGIIYAFLGLFAWLNIICADMWMTFGAFRGSKVKTKRSELKKFCLYSSYGFGVPSVIVCFMILAEQTNFLPESLTPKICDKQCYFDSLSSADYFVYFVTPMAVMLMINVMLFLKTILYCIRVKNEIQRMRNGSTNEKTKRNKNFNADKEKMIMLLKLFLIMGIPWIFEMISSFISFKRFWLLRSLETVMDTINCAKGIIIFCIFVLKRNVFDALRKRFGCRATPQGPPELSILTTTTNTH